ncbi:hypothetical protein BD309DRAFT_950285 [Dichomitus squalens]|uniref:Uncharacterized protein n=1 Tax=Dichomitus squalens TaxID=114155 RepID=A0A4Q9P1H5_9APHY|nr:hypothetical protein BD309DRAFT_950285 [Dichomitus squalens]TBU64381.1 hypothetical protein BD310DRAFT_914545 [Dichomitus squalens]
MGSYGLDLSPAQAPLNCFGPSLSTRIFSRLRPRHTRKTEYNNRLRDGDAQMMEAREAFQACQSALGYDARATIQMNLEGLRIERDRLLKFSDYGGSQRTEEDALSRAEVFRANAARIPRVQTARRGAHSAQSPSQPRGLSTSMHSPSRSPHSGSGSGTGSRHASSEHSRASARSHHPPLPRTSPYAEEPLQMLQTRAGPVVWHPSPPAPEGNTLWLHDLDIRGSPRASFKNGDLHGTPASSIPSLHGTPRGSIPSLNMAIVGLSSTRASPTSLKGSPADSIGAYSLGSDGFPRPSRRAPQRRGTIQSTTSLPRSQAAASRQGTHSSHGSPAHGALSSRQSSVQTSRSGTTHSHSSPGHALPRPSLDSGKRSGSYQSTRSDERRSRGAYARGPSSLRTSSVPPENRSPYGVPYVTDSPGRYHH